MNQTEKRKRDHVRICLEENVSAHYNYWDSVHLIHNALPEINEDEIDLSTTLFGKKLGAPLVISAITGGYSEGKIINENLAIAAEKFKLAMGVGSQRSALEKQDLKDTYSVINNYDIPLKIANIGASQMVIWDKKQILENAEKIVTMIEADILAVCLNFLQEAVQPEGEIHAKGCLEAITMLADEFKKPILIKESGAGISYNVASLLKETKIAGIDVGGFGGTSFSAVEYYRAKTKNDQYNMREGKIFWDWGIPTPASIVYAGEATNWEMPLIATGGIRNGLDAAKALILGADAAGIARTLLRPATQDIQATILELNMILKELQTTMFLVGAETINNLDIAEVKFSQELKTWV
ncbi:MAG: type 2 isopentenyl-diphosphate Delta-isomerase [Thermoplasmatota archaeon]